MSWLNKMTPFSIDAVYDNSSQHSANNWWQSEIVEIAILFEPPGSNFHTLSLPAQQQKFMFLSMYPLANNSYQLVP